jgi:hypothetical protein
MQISSKEGWLGGKYPYLVALVTTELSLFLPSASINPHQAEEA